MVEKWFLVMLGTRPENGCAELGRETFLAEVEWEDDWPVVNPQVGKVLERQNLKAFEGKDEAFLIHFFWILLINCHCTSAGIPSEYRIL